MELHRPGKPMQTAVVEGFNGRLRDECLNEGVFTTLAEFDRIIERISAGERLLRRKGRPRRQRQADPGLSARPDPGREADLS